MSDRIEELRNSRLRMGIKPPAFILDNVYKAVNYAIAEYDRCIEKALLNTPERENAYTCSVSVYTETMETTLEAHEMEILFPYIRERYLQAGWTVVEFSMDPVHGGCLTLQYFPVCES